MKSIEIYGFVGWVGSIGVFLLFVLWSFLPDSVLNSVGIYFYPDKQWALAIPSIAVMTIIFFLTFYQFLNMANSQPFHSYTTMEDNYTLYHTKRTELQDGLPEIYDIPVPVINDILFGDKAVMQKFNPQFANKEKGNTYKSYM